MPNALVLAPRWITRTFTLRFPWLVTQFAAVAFTRYWLVHTHPRCWLDGYVPLHGSGYVAFIGTLPVGYVAFTVAVGSRTRLGWLRLLVGYAFALRLVTVTFARLVTVTVGLLGWFTHVVTLHVCYVVVTVGWLRLPRSRLVAVGLVTFGCSRLRTLLHGLRLRFGCYCAFRFVFPRLRCARTHTVHALRGFVADRPPVWTYLTRLRVGYVRLVTLRLVTFTRYVGWLVYGCWLVGSRLVTFAVTRYAFTLFSHTTFDTLLRFIYATLLIYV